MAMRNQKGIIMKYKSDAFEAIHEDAMASFEMGAISEERMKE